MLTAFLHVLRHSPAPRLLMHSRVALAVICVLALAGWPRSGPWASVPFPHIKQQFRIEAVSWAEPQNMIIGGVPISTLPFVSPHSAVDVAARFSSEQAIFQRVLSTPGQLILSGVKDDWHWIAVLSDDASGSSGYVSAMSSTPIAMGAPPVWLPPGLSVALSVSNADDDQTVVHHVHHLSEAPSAVGPRLASWLADQGWKAQYDPGDIPGRQQWYRSGENLFVLMHSHLGGTVMFTQQKVGGTP